MRGFHCIRPYGLFAGVVRRDNIARIRRLLAPRQTTIPDAIDSNAVPEPWRGYPCRGGQLIVIEILTNAVQPRALGVGAVQEVIGVT